MTLEAGHNLLHYRLLEKLGEGGMGVVWKAVDTTLDREAAIKVLPDLLTTEPERLARFEREAKLLASLSHPNIAAVYGLHQGQGRHFLAMELVRGEDLGQRARREPFSTPEALEIARQIAEALEAAHEQGIIHRDLKPANVMLTQDGKVKVLDFGLAKALEAEPASGSLSMSPTITRGTEMGVILGTAAYMSPEQARGRPADRRADIWSFGVVLFEMLSGRQGFRGDTVTDVLAQVLTSAPDWDALPGDTPATVRTLLRRCLEKDAGRRLQAIGEARIAIEDHQAHPEEEAEPGTQATGGGTARGLRLAFGATAIVALLALGWALTRPAGDPLPQRRYLLDVDVDTTQGDSKFAISPDGSRITFITDERLFVWELDELQPRELSGAGSPVNGTPFWSPDGSSIGFLRTGTLYRLPATDGPAQTICRLPGPSSIAAWGPDDTIVFPTTRGPLYRVSALGGDPQVLLALDPERDVDFHMPAFLPDGGLVYTVHRPEGVDTIEAWRDGKRTVVLRLEGQARNNPQVLNWVRYARPGHLVYRREQGNTGIWAVPFSPATLKVTGEPFLVVSQGDSPSVARDGTLTYLLEQDTGPRRLVLVDREGNELETLGEPQDNLRDPAVSPDGTRVAYAADEDGSSDIWIYDFERRRTTRLTFTPDDEAYPAWMPAGDRIVFDCAQGEGPSICSAAADGSDTPEVVARKAAKPAIAPDGKSMIYTTSGEIGRGLRTLALVAGAEPEWFLESPSGAISARVAPGGRWVTYVSWETGSSSIFVRRYPSGDGKWEVALSQMSYVRWNPDGSELFWVDDRTDRSRMFHAPVEAGDSFRVGRAEMLFSSAAEWGTRIEKYDVMPDGKRFVLTLPLEPPTVREGIVVLQNWYAGFEGR